MPTSNRHRSAPPRKRKSRVTPRDFDTITRDEIEDTAPHMSRVFSRYVWISIFLHASILAVTAGEFLIVPWWTLYGRAVLAVRLLLLLCVGMYATCCGVVRVVYMYGSGLPGKTLRAMRPMPVLAMWLILGYIDLYLVRIPSIFIDAASPFIPGQGQTLQAGLLRSALGFVLIFEFHLTLNLVYQKGVRWNVLFNLLRSTPTETV